MIYLDKASTKQMTPLALTAYNFVVENAWGNPSNNYRLSSAAKDTLRASKAIIADTLKCDSEEIFFTSGASEGNAFVCNQGTIVYCSPYEHHNYDNDKTVVVHNPEIFFNKALEEKDNWVLQEKYSKCVYEHILVSSITGEIFDVNKDFDIAKQLNMITAMDITQAYGNMNINIHDYNCDIAVTSAHKFGGPRGVGFMYIRKEAQSRLQPMIYGTQQNGLRGGTENVPAIYAMAVVAPNVTTVKENSEKCSKLKQIVKDKLASSGIEYRINEGENNIPSTINFSLKNIESEIIQSILSDKEIYIGVGSACNDGSMPVDSVLKEMKVEEEFIHGPIRLSFDVHNSESEIITAMNEIIKTYKEMKS